MQPQTLEEPALDRYVDDQTVASVLGLSKTYIKQLRIYGGGPQFSKLGRKVRYRLRDVYAWAESRTVSSTSELAVA